MQSVIQHTKQFITAGKVASYKLRLNKARMSTTNSIVLEPVVVH